MLSQGSTLDEVAALLGHEPGSPMTKRYARFIPEAQQRIANQAELVMRDMLDKVKIANFETAMHEKK